jgi:phage recombination protein Bet
MSTEVMVQDFGREKLDLIKQTVAKGATDLELELFMHACKRTGLDPLMKQMYAIKRWSAADKREVMSFQTGIDGYRLIADRTGLYAGSDEPVYEQVEAAKPLTAKVTVYKIVGGVRCPFSASARWEEYVQTNREGQPTSMWKKMPFLMLGKCAEALALRKAFPAELSGVYTHEEMMQADEETPSQRVIQNKVTAQAKIAELANDKPADTAAGEGGTARQDGGDGSVGSSVPQHHQEGPDAAAPSIFEQSQAVADWSAVLADTNDLPGLQKHWKTITKDARLDSTQKVDLFKTYQKRVKDVGKKK